MDPGESIQYSLSVPIWVCVLCRVSHTELFSRPHWQCQLAVPVRVVRRKLVGAEYGYAGRPYPCSSPVTVSV